MSYLEITTDLKTRGAGEVGRSEVGILLMCVNDAKEEIKIDVVVIEEGPTNEGPV